MRFYESKIPVSEDGESAQPYSDVPVEASRGVTGGIRGIYSRATCDSNEECRSFFLPSDVSQVKAVIVLLALVIALFVISDYLNLGLTATFYVLAALRAILVVYCGLQYIYLNRTTNHRAYDRSLIVFLLVVVFSILLVNATRPHNFLPHIIVIDIAVFVFYLVIPTRFLYQAVPSFIFSVGEIFLISITFEVFMATGLFTAILSLIFANVAAAIVSLQLHSYRSRIYQSVIDRKETDRLVAIGQTAGMIGHDIRNPLQAIVSELYIAKESLSESPSPPEVKMPALESISLIEEQTDYISKIVSDLQDYARPIKPEYREVDLSKIIVSVFQVVRLPDNIEVKINVAEFPKMVTDQVLIRRALTNLVNNAIQAMPEGGVLSLNAAKIGETIVISVSDTGGGIPEEIKEKLFTPLVTTKAKGQGLGLAVVKRLVEALGGTIAFESQIDKGTTFTIRLPSHH